MADGDVVFMYGFENALQPADLTTLGWSFGGAPWAVSAVAESKVGAGAYSLYASGGGGTGRSWQTPAFTGMQTGWAHAAVYQQGTPSANRNIFIAFSGSGAAVFIGYKSGGYYEVYVGGTMVATLPYVADVWTHWTFKFDLSGSNVVATIYRDGVEAVSETTGGTTGAGGSVDTLAGTGNIGGYSSSYYVDGLAVIEGHGSDWYQPLYIAKLAVDGTNSAGTWTASDTTTHGDVSDADLSTYASTGSAADVLDLSIDDRASVDASFDPVLVKAVAVHLVGASDTITPDSVDVTLLEDGVAAAAAENSGVLIPAGSLSTTIVQDNNGTEWASADLDNLSVTLESV